MNIRLGAYPAFLMLQGGAAFAFSLIVTVNLVWQAEVAQLTPLQLVLVGTVLELTTLLGEVPTGIVADTFSRRLSIVIGMLTMGAGFMLEGLVPRFEAILVANVVWGLGATFASGATQAWIADEVGELAAPQAFMRGAQATQLGMLIAIPASIALASFQLNVPIVIGAALFLGLGSALAVLMPETGFRPQPAAERNMLHAVRHGAQLVRGSPILMTLLFLPIVFGLSSEGLDRLFTPHLLWNFELPPIGGLDPIAWFGVLRGGGMLLSIGAVEWIRRRVNTTDGHAAARWLFAADALRIGAVLVFALTGSLFVAVLAFWAITVLRRVAQPIYAAWFNQQLESTSRATLFSMSGQMDSLGQIVGGPMVGLLGNTSLRAALAVTGVALAPALVLYARTMRR